MGLNKKLQGWAPGQRCGLEVEGFQRNSLRSNQQLAEKCKTWRTAIKGFFGG